MRPGTIPSLIVIASLTAIAFVHAFAYRRFDVAPRLAIATTSMSWLMIASWAAFSGKWILASVSCFSAIVGVYEQIQWRRAPPFLDKFPPQTSLLSPALFACSALVHGAAAITMYWAFMPDVSDDAYQVTNQWMKSGSESVAAQIDDPKSRAQFQAMCAQHGWKDGIELNSSGLARIEARGDRVWTWIPIKAGDLPMLWRVENGEWKLDEVRELLAR